MKKSLQFTALLLYICTQSWSQMKNWYIAPNKMDMSIIGTVPPVPILIAPVYNYITNNSAAPALRVANGFYDNYTSTLPPVNGNLLFYIADGTVYDYNNTVIGTIPNSGAEVAIVPFGTNATIPCQRKYNIFSTSGGVSTNVALWKTVLDLNAYSLSPADPIDGMSFGTEFGAIAVSKVKVKVVAGVTKNYRNIYFMAGSGTVGVSSGQINRLEIDNDGTVSTSVPLYPNPALGVTNSNAGGEVFSKELELSPDGKWLAWASYAQGTIIGQPTQSRYHYIALDVYGDLDLTNYNTSNVYQQFNIVFNNIPTPYNDNTAGFRGIEFDATSKILFMGAGADGIYSTIVGIPFTNSFIKVNNSDGSTTTSFGFSQIELASNGYMYASSDNVGNLKNIGAFNPLGSPLQIDLSHSFTLTNPPKDIYNLLGSNPNSTFYTLPDQIDGQDYSTIVPVAVPAVLTDGTYTFGAGGSQTATWSYTGTNPWLTASADIHIIKELRIKNNSHLTINNMTFKFSPEAKVVIEQGSTLTLDGTTFTSNYVVEHCSITSTWLGVEVWGISTANQNATQGKLVMKGSSIIEYAQCGVSAYSIYNNVINLNTTGGIIKASDNSLFKDNNMDVDFKTYTKSMSSSFYDCFFKTTDDYPFSTAPVHAAIENCGNVTFGNCSFSQVGLPAINMQSVGIKTADASFTLNNSEFIQLWYGINATHITSNKTFASYQSSFIDNYTGILVNSVNGVVLKDNLFEIGGNANQTINVANHTGIILQNSSGFTIEENSFINSNSAINGVSKRGINISNCGSADNEIYKNTFSNLDYGNIALNINRDNTAPSLHGLQYFCNLNTANTTRDFQIGSPANSNNGICLTQGSSMLSAGNTFSHFGGIGSNTDLNNNTLQPLDYYYSNSTSFHVPWYYNNTVIHLTTNANLCPPHAGNELTILPESGVQLLSSNYDSAAATFQDLNTIYNMLMDGGDKNDLINTIQQSWPADAMQLKDELISKSPYLSQDVLHEAAQKNILPQAMLFAICMANPDATKDENFLNYLRDEIPNPLPQYMIDLQVASWDVSTARTTMQSTMGYYSIEMARLSNAILSDLYFKSAFVSDSTTTMDTANYNADIKYWLNRVSTLTSQYDLIEIYLNENNITQAEALLDVMLINFKMSDDQLQAYNDYVYYFNFRKNCKVNGIELSNLNEIQISELEIFATGNDNLAKSLAQNLLCYYYHKCIDPDLETPSSGNRLISKSAASSEKITNPVSVSPNPAVQYAIFTYALPALNNKAVLVICDVTGKIIMQMNLNAKEGQEIWDTRNIQNGLYYYFVQDGISKIAKGQVTVQH